jgi:metallophosphoesterase (TIGR03768 family)
VVGPVCRLGRLINPAHRCTRRRVFSGGKNAEFTLLDQGGHQGVCSAGSAVQAEKTRGSTALGTLSPRKTHNGQSRQKALEMKSNNSEAGTDTNHGFEITRRDFLKYSAWTILANYTFPALAFSTEIEPAPLPTYPIDSVVETTRQRMLSFSMDIDTFTEADLYKVSEYHSHGYGLWTYGAGLPVQKRLDLMPGYYNGYYSSTEHSRRLLRFFSISDIHITDKESPNQLIYLQQENPEFAGNNTSIYSPVMLYTTHVLDAAIQTVNALHHQTDQAGQKNPFDFGISLGDACNSTQYNELRWYIDVIEGREIHPSSSGLGVDTIDYQKPYQAAGLDRGIPFYQTLGNHDHFFIGSFPVNTEIDEAGTTIRDAYIQPTVWCIGDVLIPDPSNFPVLIDADNLKPNDSTHSYYTGILDGTSEYGEIVHAGSCADIDTAPTIPANADRRSLSRVEWMDEFIKSETSPDGYGFKLIDPSYAARDPGFACYSFIPKQDVPLKVIVLDDTQSEEDGSKDIHGHGYLDTLRWEWLQAELQAGQDNDQLMIIAAHVPIGVAAIGSETEWWDETVDGHEEWSNAVDLATLIRTLQDTPNLLMWMAGHRHMNTVKAFVSPDRENAPWKGFWQVETSSLRDWPQQLRTFEIYLNRDYTLSIVTTNVDPAVQAGTPAATSRAYAIAVQQITKNDITLNNLNYRSIRLTENTLPISVASMDPSRPQNSKPDPTIKFLDLSVKDVPCNASYNAELVKRLSPTMVKALKRFLAA